mmetsp:Transcript_25796/g.56573  ORF Transcript_25796/g.56573 Transcript_25796/m.56573 type:complete len:321 (-) Transcript_25796:543-1505(-)
MLARDNKITARNRHLLCLLLLCFYSRFSPTIQILPGVQSFSPSVVGVGEIVKSSHRHYHRHIHRRTPSALNAKENDGNYDNGPSSLSNYNDSDGASKGIVGSLTGIVNKVSASIAKDSSLQTEAAAPSSLSSSAPKSSEELLDRIRKDYGERNYLWTGNLDLECFCKDCVFTDPTISFVGIDKFTENTQNLVPIVEAFAEDYRSDLLSISLGSGSSSGSNQNDCDEFFVESRWNMVGSLTASPWLFWKPKIDVIGRTKFWFRKEAPGEDDDSHSSDDGVFKVYFYDESWEIPAWKALLQIVTPAGTVPRTSNMTASDTKK